MPRRSASITTIPADIERIVSHDRSLEYATIVATIVATMRARSLTQAVVAAQCEWSQPLLSDYLAGRRELGTERLIRLAAAVGLDVRLDAQK